MRECFNCQLTDKKRTSIFALSEIRRLRPIHWFGPSPDCSLSRSERSLRCYRSFQGRVSGSKGKIVTTKGHLGAFNVTVDDFARSLPSSQGTLTFGSSRDGTQSHCDIILELSGGSALFAAPDLRDGYLRVDPGNRSAMRFVEDACVQCGLRQATCPENVITFKPQTDFRAARAPARVLKEGEEPFCCVGCDIPFVVKSTIEHVVAKLEGSHWMYPGSSRRVDLTRMCEDCRLIAVSAEGFDPYAAPGRSVRTTDDYLRERDYPMRGSRR